MSTYERGYYLVQIWSVRANTNDEQVHKKNFFSDFENDNEGRQWRHQR